MDERSNKQFFEELCDKYYEKVFLYCLHLARSRGLSSDFAEECTQDTFLEAGKQVYKLREHPEVQAWLYVVARNLVCGSIRKILRKEKHETITDYTEFDIADESCLSLEELFDYKIDVDKLCTKVLEVLDEDEYKLYIDYYKEKIPVINLSKKYNISKTALTTRAYRLKKKIKMIARDFLENSENNSENF
ncbi:sigma-70 family RNA polymerase sigma factor [Sedimentibacter sp.]|uniref:RNA polymerase sigma factor n=1 Tax=Sedimentibacter sp. TaxID=1960295 RepID=UPI0028AD15EF|nr:sigma-70 family RNA polymerase sigma factor [Sedimentibacter sp.]